LGGHAAGGRRPLQDPSLLADPDRNLLVIIKDGKIFKNRVTA